jgi:UDP-N-acetylglucosamine diphosphorylase/glucosamine-1-phosphate N-acetyltransferase
MNVVLFDEELTWKNLLPLTFTRPVSEIRIGILTIKEKWDKHLNTVCSYHTQEYLSKKYPLKKSDSFLLINSKYCPDKKLSDAINGLKPGQALYKEGHLIAFNGLLKDIQNASQLNKIDYEGEVLAVNQVWDIFQKNGQAIKNDFELITNGKKGKPLSNSVTVIGDKNLVFLEEGAKAEACFLNTSGGPIYIGKDAEIMEGSVVRGPFALGEHSALKMSAKIYGPTTIGPESKVGGEVSNCVIFGFSNKAHDGFIGNSVIGEWCNLGADTNSSNLKNNYANVKLYNYAAKKQMDTGLQFCGLIMGDHSKSGINTMFNTGTVVGVGCNIYGGSFPATYIPNFSWGGSEGFEEYRLEKLFGTAEKVYERRGLKFGDLDKDILKAVASRSN